MDDGRHVGEGLIAGYEGIKDLKRNQKNPPKQYILQERAVLVEL